jgi:hypothetical protein
MIVVRNVFRIKFGQAREAVAAWKEGIGVAERAGLARGTTRLLTDVAGPDFYTLVVETTYDSMAEMERSARALIHDTRRGRPSGDTGGGGIAGPHDEILARGGGGSALPNARHAAVPPRRARRAMGSRQ